MNIAFVLSLTTLLTVMFLAGCHYPPRHERPVQGPSGAIVPLPDGDDTTWQWTAPAEQASATGTWQDCHHASWRWLQQESPRAMPNLPLPTLGGKQYWRDVEIRPVMDESGVARAWRLQQHAVSGHYRLLDGNDWRRAWGSKEACLVALERWLPKYDTSEEDQLWLLPGIWRSKDAMQQLANDAVQAGWVVRVINYPSIVTDLADHAAQFPSY